MASRAPAPRPRRSTGRSRSERTRVQRRRSSTCPVEDLVRRMAGRWVCHGERPPVQRDLNPPQVPGVCDIDGSPLIQRDDDQRGDRPRPDGAAAARRSTRSSTTTGEHGVLRLGRRAPADRRCPEPDARRRRSDAATARPRPDMVTRKSPRRDRADAPRRPDRRRGRSPSSRPSSCPASPPRELDRIAERPHPGRRRDAVVQGLPGRSTPRRPFPASLCISLDDEVVHGIPGDRVIRDGQVVSVDAGAIVEGWHGDGGAHVHRRRGAGRAARARRHDAARPCWPASRPRVPGNRIGDISAAVEDVATPGRLRHRPPVRRPRHRHRDARGTAGAELPLRRPGHEARAGPLPRDRADAHARRPRRRASGPTAGRSSTSDGSLAAHFEHTIAITDHGPRDPDVASDDGLAGRSVDLRRSRSVQF